MIPAATRPSAGRPPGVESPGPVDVLGLPSVSIIIPARNEEGTLTALLDSLATLDYPRDRLEIIVVDHKSTDRTCEIAAGYGAGVIAYRGDTIAGARNDGAKAASGTLLAFVA